MLRVRTVTGRRTEFLAGDDLKIVGLRYVLAAARRNISLKRRQFNQSLMLRLQIQKANELFRLLLQAAKKPSLKVVGAPQRCRLPSGLFGTSMQNLQHKIVPLAAS